MKVSEAIERLQGLDPDDHVHMDLWLPEDIRDIADDKGKVLSEAQVNRVLHLLETEYDSELGTNYGVISARIDDVMEGR